MSLLLVFIILNVVNVILQTIKSLCTVKCGKGVAALVNAIAYGLYTVVIIYTVCDLPLVTKAIVVALCNLIGVYVVKLLEEKAHRDKIWKIELTVPNGKYEDFIELLNATDIPYSEITENTDKYTIFNIYCATQNQSLAIKEIVKKYNVKYFVSETKTL